MPPDLQVLLWKHKATLRNYLIGLKDQSPLKIFVITCFSIGFWVGLYGLFFSGFQFLNGFTDVLDLVISLLFSLFYLTLTLMLILSNAILLFSALYHSEESDFLANKPIYSGNIFIYFFVLCLFYSSWAFLFLGTPLMLAYGIVKQVHISFYPIVLLYFMIFMLIPAAISSILVVFVPFILPKLSLKKIGIVLAILLILTVGYFLFQFDNTEESEKYTEQWLTSIFDKLSFTRSIYLPSFWITRGTLSLANQEWKEVGYNLLLLMSNALFLLMLSYWLFEKLYFSGFQRISGSGIKKLYRTGSRLEQIVMSIPFLANDSKILVLKDIRNFLRDPVQYGQFLILFGLLGFYILNLRTLAYDGKDIFWKNLIAFLNLGATSLCLSTYASRFIYPLISLEGKRFWILGVSPLSRKRLLWAKFFFSFFSLLCISETLVLTSCLMLKVPWSLTLLQAVTCIFFSFGISGLTVGLSAIYMNLKDSDPAKIVSGFGGTLNLVLAIFYLVSITLTEAIVSYMVHASIQRYEKFYWLTQSVGINFMMIATGILVVVLSLSVCFIPMFLGIKKFETMQF
ncbi:MAG: hypothetical protein AABZ60_00930 [Planctomycetota bacterium]